MKKLISLWLFLAAVSLLPRAAEGQTYQKTFGPGSGRGSCKTLTGKFIMTGESSNNVFLSQVDQNGSTLWFKKYTAPQATVGNSVIETNDGGFIIAGTYNDGGPTSKVLLLKTDSDGNSLWTKIYGGSQYESGSEVKQTFDGGYVIVGSTKSFGTNFDDIYVIKTDSDGNLEWSRDIADSPVDIIDYGNSIVQGSDSGYAICGRIYNASNNSGDIGLIKLDVNGNFQWAQSYGETGDDRGNTIINTSDGGYAIGGFTTMTGISADAFLMKTDSQGSLQWNISFGGTDYEDARSVRQLTDGSYVVTGSTQSFGNGVVDFYLSKFDSNQIFLWTKTFGGTGPDYGYSAEETPDKGFMVVGHSPTFGADIYLVKTDSSGYSGCNEFTPNMSMTLASVTVTTPSLTVTTPATADSAIIFTDSNVNTVITLCSLVSVSEVPTEPFVWEGASLFIYDLLGRPVNQVSPDYFYIYRYIDKNKNEKSFLRRPN